MSSKRILKELCFLILVRKTADCYSKTFSFPHLSVWNKSPRSFPVWSMISKLLFCFIFTVPKCLASIPSVEEASSLVKFGPGTLSQCENFRESTARNSDGATVNVIESKVLFLHVSLENRSILASILRRRALRSSCWRWKLLEDQVSDHALCRRRRRSWRWLQTRRRNYTLRIWRLSNVLEG